MIASLIGRFRLAYPTGIALCWVALTPLLMLLIAGGYSAVLAQTSTPTATSTAAVAAYQAGLVSFKNWDLDAAVSHFSEAIQLDPNYVPAYVARCDTYRRHAQLDLALADCNKAIELNAHYAEAFAVRSFVQLDQGNTTEALGDANMAIMLDPNLVRGYDARAFGEAIQHEDDAADKDFNKAIQLDPTYPSTYYDRGIAEERKGDYDGAIADYTQAIAYDPKFVAAYINRGNAKVRKQDYDGAIADYTQAIPLDPKHVLAYVNRGNAKVRKQDYDGAIADENQAIQLDPKHALAYYLRGLAEYQKQDFGGAKADYNQAVQLDPKYASAPYARAAANAQQSSALTTVAGIAFAGIVVGVVAFLGIKSFGRASWSTSSRSLGYGYSQPRSPMELYLGRPPQMENPRTAVRSRRRKAQFAVHKAQRKSRETDIPMLDVASLALEHPDSTPIYELYDVVDEKLLLPITQFQLNYLESLLGEPDDEQDGWNVPKDVLPSMVADIQTINDYLQSLPDRSNNLGNSGAGPEARILDHKVIEIGMLHESFKEALADYDDFDISLKPIESKRA